MEAFGNDHIVVIEQDSYYRDQTHLPYEERIQTNYDHPDAFDTGLMVSQIRSLQQGKPIENPCTTTPAIRGKPKPYGSNRARYSFWRAYCSF